MEKLTLQYVELILFYYKIENFIGFIEGDIEDLVSTNVLIQVTSGKF